MTAIDISHLTKEYKLGQIRSLKDALFNTVRRASGRDVQAREIFKALDDVSLSINAGEIVGLIGNNGAGKSTLLKHIAKITQPTTGSVVVNGNIAPLIEVGAGLNPELTGRENIYLNSAILGIPQEVIRGKIDEIIEFSELEQFINTPLKRYSSGMIVRLGFAIATSLDAEILIVDEVLAVGDLAFQRKCFDRMETRIRKSGRTVLLVSHNIRQVERICSRVVLLDHGRIVADGPASEICSEFYQRSNRKIKEVVQMEQAINARVSGTGEVKLEAIDVLDEHGTPTSTVASRSQLLVRIRFRVMNRLEQPEIIVGTHTTDFVYLTASSTVVFPDRPDLPPGIQEVEYYLPYFPLAAGEYCIRFSVFDKNRRSVFEGETLKTFSVIEPEGRHAPGGWWTLNLPTEWKLAEKKFVAPTYTSG